MEILHKKYDGVNLIIVQGALDGNEDAAINEIILNAAPGETCHLWIDCSDMKQIMRLNRSYSDFINYLLYLKRQGVQILLYGVDNTTVRILKLLKLDHSFAQAHTLDDAYITLSHTLAVPTQEV